MAVWQFVIDFVPEQFLLDTYGHVPETMLPEHRKQEAYFRNSSFNVEEIRPYLQAFGTIDTNSWSGTLFCRGEADHDAFIYFDEETGLLRDVYCRIDMRQPDERFIFGIVTLATAFNCHLMSRGTRQIFEPAVSQLLQAMQQSNAYRFVIDPQKFLDGFSKGNLSGY